MPVLLSPDTHHYDLVMVWDHLGGNVRVRRNGSTSVVDPATEAPLEVFDELTGITSSTVTSDANGRVKFVAGQGAVKLLADGLVQTVTSAEAIASGAFNAAAAQEAQVAAEQAADDAAASAAGAVNKADKAKLAFNVKEYGAVGNGSTNDATAINSCIAAAIAAGGEVYWPAGTYLVSANLASFWSVNHSGAGVISSSGNTFRITPTGSDVNTIYLTATGSSNSNDGLSATRPVASLSQVDTMLQRAGSRLLQGNWRVRLSGAIQGGWTFYKTLRTPNPIVFEGDPLVSGQPVTTINYVVGWAASSGCGSNLARGCNC